jgi:hypothetical protein
VTLRFWVGLRGIALLFFVLSLVACTPRKTRMAMRMVGQSRDVVLAEYGPPTQTMVGDSGETIWIFTEHRVSIRSSPHIDLPSTPPQGRGESFAYGFAQGMNSNATTTATTKTKNTLFWFDSDGKVSRWARN